MKSSLFELSLTLLSRPLSRAAHAWHEFSRLLQTESLLEGYDRNAEETFMTTCCIVCLCRFSKAIG